ncbi:sensor histidine kinase [Methylobacterium nodulans]|uniref:histidine kinase n=1 Tax=Methylobacterium nodulans (strain LMG 21967 / CNCM I-2342 / ORS 2060) TaxID=460265 RepID=B8IFI3_METNO|nr:sensor histidine kinase [Methylobacterium nodulans]ACL57718.1 histidine kinase [Methylobacterium nodulans ORS 2060]
MSRHPPSLRRGLMARMLLPAAALALVLGFGGALVIRDVVETTHDRLLDGSVLAIAERLALDEDNEVTVDLPRVALGMLESQAQDRIYYSVSYGGQLVTGYRDLPRAAVTELEPGVTRHWDSVMRGAPVRVAAQARRIYGKPEPVLVQVAETRDARRALQTRLLGGLILLEAGLLGLVGVLTWHGIGRGLEPLNRLSAEIDRRAVPGAISLRPLDASQVPKEAVAPVLAFNTLLARLEQAMGAMRRFTADASHQMRTPLAVLRTHLDLARRYGVAASSEGRAALDDIEGAAERLEHLLSQLIALARADEAADAVTTTDLDLAEVAAAVLAEQVPRALAAGVEIAFERPDGPVMILAHPTLVGEILGNLIDNAIRYGGSGASVVVRVANDAAGARVEIEDDGPGIPSSEREKVFARFYRVARSGGPEGSGLGLAVVRALADRIGAAVTLEEGSRGGPGLLARVVFRPVSSGLSGPAPA